MHKKKDKLPYSVIDNTTDFGSVIMGLSPIAVTTKTKNNMKKELVFGHGVNDYDGKTYNPLTGKREPFYKSWQAILQHCYSEKYQKKYPTYRGCTVCEKWLSLKMFRGWYNAHYVKGWHICKTLFDKDNMEYAPYKCCFLPKEIVNFLYRRKKNDGLPCGIVISRMSKPNHTIYLAIIQIEKVKRQIAKGENLEEVYKVYCDAREKRAKELAKKYKCYLEGRVYQTLMEYKEK